MKFDARQVTCILIVAVTVLLVSWDIVAAILPGQNTISEVVRDFIHQYPVAAFVGGFVCGHLVWPQQRPPDRLRLP